MIRLAVRCRPQAAERVLAELVELAPEGVEEERGSEYVEYAIYGVPGELPELPQLRAAAGEALVDIMTTEVPDDWADSWRDFHRPVVVADRVRVRPSWERAAGGTEIDVVIDPGQAFGTGAHATTVLSIELLVGLAERGIASGPLIDLGTGSGVLAIVGAKLGFDPVSACDHERSALDAAEKNAELNGVEITLSRVNLREELPPLAPTVVANLTGPLLVEVAARLAENPNGTPHDLACSGLLEGEADRVSGAFAAAGLRERERLEAGGWAGLVLERSE